MTVSMSSPVGCWSGEVTYGDKVDEYTVVFSDDGSLTLDTADSAGSGTWAAAAEGSFSFEVKEVFKLDEAGTPPAKVLPGAAYIKIMIDARRDGGSFSGTGTAEIYTADDQMVASTPVDTSARFTPVTV
jgi:hypothetical protein